MGVEQEYENARKEEEKGSVQERRQRFNRPGKLKVVDAFSKKSTNPTSLMRAVLWLCGPNISTSPLLQECRKQCTRETDGQTQEPKGVNPDGVFWWSKR